MANYFSVALTGMVRSWLMNLPQGSLTSWKELCHQFMTNFESAYSRPSNETDLHVVQQRRGGGGITVLFHLVVLPGSQHHPSYLQCFCCRCIPAGCEG
jgi:hypothetical protein